MRVTPLCTGRVSPEPGLLLRGGASGPSRGVGGHRGPDQCLEGGLVELLAFADVDGSARIPLETGVEQLLGVLEGGASEEGELHDLLVRLPRTDAAVMGPDRSPRTRVLDPFPFLLDLGVRVVDELANPGERLAPPVPQLLDPLRDVLRSGRAVRGTFRRHGLCDPSLDLAHRAMTVILCLGDRRISIADPLDRTWDAWRAAY